MKVHKSKQNRSFIANRLQSDEDTNYIVQNATVKLIHRVTQQY